MEIGSMKNKFRFVMFAATIVSAGCNYETQTTNSDGTTTNVDMAQYTVKAPGTVLTLYCGIPKEDRSGVVAWYAVQDATVGSTNINSGGSSGTPLYNANFTNLFGSSVFTNAPKCRPYGAVRTKSLGYTTSFETKPNGSIYFYDSYCNQVGTPANACLSAGYQYVETKTEYKVEKVLNNYQSLLQIRVKSSQEILPVYYNVDAKDAVVNCMSQNASNYSDIIKLNADCTNAVGGGYKDMYAQENSVVGQGAKTVVKVTMKCGTAKYPSYCAQFASNRGIGIY